MDRGPQSEQCPDEGVLQQYIERGAALDDATEARLEQHLSECDVCRGVVILFARNAADVDVDAMSTSERRSPPGPIGPRFGRYRVSSPIGAGAMGIVYAADDPQLERRVAIKVLHRAGDGTDAVEHVRLVREAQSLAKLAHPNVVAVHDIGVTDEGQVWLAMELVHGVTADAWFGGSRRGWRTGLELMLQAGRGLRAVHARGLLHRDFKLANIMIEATGDGPRARVMDFGLSRRVGGDERRDVQHDVAASVDDDSRLTRTGTLIGTPAYMAPEQLNGETATEASDQFAYCVSTWQTLCGTRPFVAGSVSELKALIERAKPRTVPGVAVPRWLRAILQRGMATDPGDRWPSMDALVDALANGRARTLRRRVLIGTGVAAIGVGGAVGWQRLQARELRVACEAEGGTIGTTWDSARAAAVRAGISSTGLSYAEGTVDRVIPRLNAYARQWARLRTDVCMGRGASERWDGSTVDSARWCFDERRTQLDALASQLQRGEPGAVRSAVLSVTGLGDLTWCADAGNLRRSPSPPAELRERAEQVQVLIAQAMSLDHAGEYERGLRRANEALSSAQTLAWGPMIARARLVVGGLQRHSGAFEEAEAAMETAYFEAARVNASAVVYDAAEALASLVGDQLERPDDGMRWSRLAELSLDAITNAPPELWAAHRFARADIYSAMGSFEEARDLHRETLAAYEDALGPDHPALAQNLNNLAIVSHRLGDADEARSLMERALRLHEDTLGPAHPTVASTLSNLANLDVAAGRYERAGSLHERALRIKLEALGERHPSVAASINNLGLVREHQGVFAEAQALHERALSIREEAYGPQHPQVAASLNNLAIVHESLGELPRARELHERALTIKQSALGPDHPDVAATLTNLAEIHRRQESYETARDLHARALAIKEKVYGLRHPNLMHVLIGQGSLLIDAGTPADAEGPLKRALAIAQDAYGADDPKVATPVVGLAEAALAQDHAERAVAYAERAAGLMEAGDGRDIELAEVRFLLARALRAVDPEDPRALHLATDARTMLARHPSTSSSSTIADIDAWLARRP